MSNINNDKLSSGSNRNYVVSLQGTINEEIIVSASNEDDATDLALDILLKYRVIEYVNDIGVEESESVSR